jgi:hypothetical protein
MNIDDLFPSKYIKASDLDDAPVTLRIASVRTELMNDGSPKAVLYFANGKPLVLNVTNKNVVKELYGADTDGWTGKPIQLIATTTEFGGKVVDCIRLRPPATAKPRPVTKPPKHVTEPAGEPVNFDDLGDEIPF